MSILKEQLEQIDAQIQTTEEYLIDLKAAFQIDVKETKDEISALKRVKKTMENAIEVLGVDESAGTNISV